MLTFEIKDSINALRLRFEVRVGGGCSNTNLSAGAPTTHRAPTFTHGGNP